MTKEYVSKGFCNEPDQLDGDLKVIRNECDVVYHLGTLDNEKNRRRKMNADAKKIMIRRCISHPQKPTLDVIEAVVKEK